MRKNTAKYHFDKSYHYECRVFIEQQEKSIVNCYESSPKLRDVERWIWIRNVQNAMLRILVPEGKEKSLEVQIVTQERNYTTPSNPVKTTLLSKDGLNFHETEKPISGQILIFW